MPVENKSTYAFIAGEVSPDFYGRTDLTKYSLGVKEAINYFVGYRGGLISRNGFRFAGPHTAGTGAGKLVRFRASGNDYVLVFSNLKLHFVRNGGYLLNAAKNITAVTAANPAVVTSAAHGYSNGDWVYISGVVGMTELNGRYFQVSNVAANTFELDVDSSAYTAYTSGGTVASLVSVATPYVSADLDTLNVEQRYATVTITHLNYARRRLTYVSDTNWTLSTLTSGASVAAPVGLALTPSGAGTAGAAFVVTAVIDGVESEGSAYAIHQTMVNYSVTAGSMKVTWTAVAGAEYYNVYRSLILSIGADVSTDLECGFIGRAIGNSFTDTNITADFTKTPPINYDPFASSNHPKLFKIFQQRGVYAGTASLPMTIWGSKPGDIDNFDVSTVLNAGDSYSFTLDGVDVEPIQHMLALRTGLLLFDNTAVTLLKATQTGTVSPVDALAEPQAYKGVSAAPPISINLDVLFVEAGNTSLNAMMFTPYENTFQLQDISVLSNHLFEGKPDVTRMEWLSSPNKLLYCLRDDGQIVTLTYEREQEVFGWAQMRTAGKFKDICAVREDGRYTLYASVLRYLNGAWVQSIEVMQPRQFATADAAWCVDCGLDYPHTEPAATITFTAATGTGIACTASASIFTAGDVGDIIYAGGGKAEITAYVSGTEVTCTILRDIGSAPAGVTAWVYEFEEGDWTIATPTTTVSGLWHLEGETVSVLADGDAFTDKVVANGAITLDVAASKIVVGLPFHCMATTLAVQSNNPGQEARRRMAPQVFTRVKDTRGLAVGTTYANAVEMKDRSDEDWGEELALRSGIVATTLGTGWDEEVFVAYIQRYPLPAEILSVHTGTELGDD